MTLSDATTIIWRVGAGDNARKGVYIVSDLKVDPGNDELAVFSWAVRADVTETAGDLVFVIRFACVDSGETAYVWKTNMISGIEITESFESEDGQKPNLFDESTIPERYQSDSNTYCSMLTINNGSSISGSNLREEIILTPKIPINPGIYSRTISGFTLTFFYDASENRIGYAEGSPFVVPDGAFYIRFNINTAIFGDGDEWREKVMLNEGETLAPFVKYTKPENDTPGERDGNLFDPFDIDCKTSGYELNSRGEATKITGSLWANDGYGVTNFIPVKFEKTYDITGCIPRQYIYFYDSEKAFISRASVASALTQITINVENTAYIRFEFEENNVPSVGAYEV